MLARDGFSAAKLRRNFSVFVDSRVIGAAVVVVVVVVVDVEVVGSASHAFFTAQSAASTAESTVMVTKMFHFH